jgi:ubiquinone/menaquinone biosynthesis C-methylase UbiE
LQDQAKLLLQQHRNHDSSCCKTLRHLKQFAHVSPIEILSTPVKLQEVQHALALEYGYKSWALLRSYIIAKNFREKADYSTIASYFDKSRSLSETNMTMWLNLIAELSGSIEGAKVLDLGCGTGRFSIPMATRLGFNVVGVDSSIEMLTQAKHKDSNSDVKWLLADAGTLTLPSSSFDCVLISHLLHHVDNPLKVLKECNRVLSFPGVIVIRYGAIEQIRDDVEHTFFPQAIEIDEIRGAHTKEHVEKWLLEAGFESFYSEEIIQQTFGTGTERLDAARAKGISVLSLISEESFQTGIRRLAAYVDENPDDEWLLIDIMTITVGHTN